MVFEIKNGWVYTKKRKIELTPTENKLLQVLANNKLNSVHDIYEYVFPNEKFEHSPDPYTPIRIHKCRLQQKLKLNIKTLRGRGYRLINTVLINY